MDPGCWAAASTRDDSFPSFKNDVQPRRRWPRIPAARPSLVNPTPFPRLKTQYLLLVWYVGFVVSSLAYLSITHQTRVAAQLDENVISELRALADAVEDPERARQQALDVIDLLEASETATALADRFHLYYIGFAFLGSIPLAAYAGQSMRDKLFVTRPANMPHIVYWTLFGVSTRRMAIRYMWLSVALAFVSAAVSLVTPIGYLGLFSLVTAYLYQYAVEWVDKNAYWANQTRAPFPMN